MNNTMNITIHDILGELVPTYKTENVISKPSLLLDILKLSEPFYGDTYKSLIECILSAYVSSNEFNQKNNAFIHFLQTNNINKNINKKKMLTLIKNDSTNNDLILLLSGFYNCNIWIYHLENKIFKVYYMEEKLEKYKDNLIISFGSVSDTTKIGYQLCHSNTNKKFKYEDNIIQEIIDKYLIIPVGMFENKKMDIGEYQDNPLFMDIDTSNNIILECPDEEDNYIIDEEKIAKIDKELREFINTFNIVKLLEDFNKKYSSYIKN